ncbi:MAG: PIN domain nuclease [Chloroflexota bacterium]|nr:PIN domain nuclease [Chloroflexota bacterium]MDE2852729.1 PIN domain nuclease [Chloroflexota bacterium]MDE2946848.1 PIN domain nuclease [Chloroflexota bacterium]
MGSFLKCRIAGLVLFSIAGFYIGEALAPHTDLTSEQAALVFLALGAFTGLIAAPWLTIIPLRHWRRAASELTVPQLMLAILGGLVGLTAGLMLAFPLSLLADPLGMAAPIIVSVIFGYLGLNIFSLRSREMLDVINERFFGRQRRLQPYASRQLLLDTSVLIDGRIVEIAETGFIGGTLIIPRFVLSELHRVADSSDSLRRNRGRRGLAKLNELQRGNDMPVKIVDDDPEDFGEVDAKLVALSIQLNASLVTNDFNLNQVADAQGVDVLNINALANAVRSVYIPGETFDIRIIQAGRDPNQGVGYLDDGTMVVVESGQKFMNRDVGVEVTKLINRPTGRMIFAVPQAAGR